MSNGPVSEDARRVEFWRTVVIANERGLHARAAAKFVGLASSFDADIVVARGAATVAATSIMGLLALAATPGTSLDIRARGAEAPAALEALATLVEDRFDEG